MSVLGFLQGAGQGTFNFLKGVATGAVNDAKNAVDVANAGRQGVQGLVQASTAALTHNPVAEQNAVRTTNAAMNYSLNASRGAETPQDIAPGANIIKPIARNVARYAPYAVPFGGIAEGASLPMRFLAKTGANAAVGAGSTALSEAANGQPLNAGDIAKSAGASAAIAGAAELVPLVAKGTVKAGETAGEAGLHPAFRLGPEDRLKLANYSDYLAGDNPQLKGSEINQLVSDVHDISQKTGIDFISGSPRDRSLRIGNFLENFQADKQKALQGGYLGPQDFKSLSDAKSPEEVKQILQNKAPESIAEKTAPAIAKTEDPNIIDNIVKKQSNPAPREPTIAELGGARANNTIQTQIEEAHNKGDVPAQEALVKQLPPEQQAPMRSALGLPNTDAGLSKLHMLAKASPDFNTFAQRFSQLPEHPDIQAAVEATKSPTLEDLYGNLTGKQSAAQQVVGALNEAKNIRAKQEASYAAERGQRIGAAAEASKSLSGTEAYRAKLAQLKGDLGKQEYRGISDQLNPQKAESLYTELHSQVEKLPISEFDKLNTQTALRKVVFGEGGVPTNSEIKLLQNAFGEDFANNVKDNVEGHKQALTLLQKAGEVLGVPRAIMASSDLSGGLRQGLAAATRHPIVYAQNFVKQFKFFGSEDAFQQAQKEIESHPNYDLAKEAKLSLNDLTQGVDKREEQYASSLAEKIPGIGKIVRGSDRAYTGLLNQMRFNIFNQLVDNYKNAGIDLRLPENAKALRDIGRVVNTSTGRGDFGNFLENHANTLSTVFFSPRLMASRVQMFNPLYYIKLDPIARKEALTTLASLGAFATTVLGAAKLSGAQVITDPTNSDFGKIKLGDTRLDILGGYQQYIRLGAQLAEGKITSSMTGHVTQVGSGFGVSTRKDIVYRFLENKENPILSFVTGILNGKDATGQPFNVPDQAKNLFIPLIAQDINDLMSHKNSAGLGAAVPGALGVGLQTYGLQDIQPSTKQKAYIQKLQTGGASPQQVEAVTRFYQTLKAGPDKTAASSSIDAALKAGDVQKAQQLAQQYNQNYASAFKDWAKQYSQYSSSQLVKDYRAGKLNLTSSDIHARIKAIKAKG